MKALAKMTLTELKLSSRNIAFMISTMLLPVAILAVFGGLYGNYPSERNLRIFGMGAISAQTPAYLALGLAIIALVGMPQQILTYKENKILKRLKATPIKKHHILLPIFFNYILLFLVGMVILFVYAQVMYSVHLQGSLGEFIFALTLSVATMFSMGFLIAALCKSVKQITSVGFALLLPMIFFSGATMPMGAFPGAVSQLSRAVPLYYSIALMRGIFTGTVSLVDNMVYAGILGVITIVCTVLSFVFFKWE